MNQHLQNIDTVRIIPHELHFQAPVRTSRSVMYSRKVYFIVASKLSGSEEIAGWGEMAPLDGLSPEGKAFHESMRRHTNQLLPVASIMHFLQFPSFQFAMEAANLDLKNRGQRIWFDGPFVHGRSAVPINGLIWMGDQEAMGQQIRQKLKDGYPCLKLKIGGINFEEELELLRFIRKEFSPDLLELRLDANGSFNPENAEERLKRLAEFSIHSIEQPIKAGQTESMARLCEMNLIPIALDEELIGLKTREEKQNLLHTIRPQHLIFKPSLIGGLSETREYITLCAELHIGWWITSALESNIGLNVLAQFCDHLRVDRVQGLGTGKLFTNNISSPLREERGEVSADPSGKWGQIPNLV